MSEDLQEFSYLKGMLSFRLPSSWKNSFDPVNKQAVFYQEGREGAGVLRLALAKVLRYDQSLSLIDFARDLTSTNDINQLEDGSLLCTKTEQFEYDGVDYLLFSWYHMHDATPYGAQVACFMYQASFQELQDPEFQFQLSILNQEVAATRWADLETIYATIRPSLVQVERLQPDIMHYSISEQIGMGLATVNSAGEVELMTEADAENLGFSTDSAWQTAFNNMNQIVMTLPVEAEEVSPGLTLAWFSEEFPDQASLITAPNLREAIEPFIGWPVMAILPARDFLHLFPAGWQPEPEQEKTLGSLVLEEYGGARDPLSIELFRIDEDGIVPVGLFTPEGLRSGATQQSVDEIVSASYPNPTSAKDFFNRGMVYSSMSEHQKAILEFSQAIELDPNVPDYYKMRAQEFENIGDKDSAAGDSRLANQLGRRRRR